MSSEVQHQRGGSKEVLHLRGHALHQARVLLQQLEAPQGLLGIPVLVDCLLQAFRPSTCGVTLGFLLKALSSSHMVVTQMACLDSQLMVAKLLIQPDTSNQLRQIWTEGQLYTLKTLYILLSPTVSECQPNKKQVQPCLQF